MGYGRDGRYHREPTGTVPAYLLAAARAEGLAAIPTANGQGVHIGSEKVEDAAGLNHRIVEAKATGEVACAETMYYQAALAAEAEVTAAEAAAAAGSFADPEVRAEAALLADSLLPYAQSRPDTYPSPAA